MLDIALVLDDCSFYVCILALLLFCFACFNCLVVVCFSDEFHVQLSQQKLRLTKQYDMYVRNGPALTCKQYTLKSYFTFLSRQHIYECKN